MSFKWPFRKAKEPRLPDEATSDTSQVLSIVLPEEVESLGGLPREAIAAIVKRRAIDEGDYIPADAVTPNPVFIGFMHHVIQTHGPMDPGLREAAARQGTGWVYIIDLRTPEGPQGRVPTEDIIGGFEVKSGELQEAGYWANDQHRVFTANGLVTLPESLRAAFVSELRRRKRPRM